jgi:geranylgeranyl pyrophosphate synthase
LLWREASEKRLKPIDALKIYALKTSPAFEAALYSGVRLAGPMGEYLEPIRQVARNLGVAFQILNDLQDWDGDTHNKLHAGGDVVGGRPTILLALALEALPLAEQDELLELIGDSELSPKYRLSRVRELYQQARVFETAHRLVDKHQQRAEAVADKIQPDELRRLMYYLIDTVLERPAEDAAPLPHIVPLVTELAAASPAH